jgi:hypothetical protein
MKKIQLLMLALAGFVVTSHAADGFADSVVNYDPGIGYVADYTNVSAVLGEPSTINPYGDATDVFDPPYGTNQILSIGTGGSLTVEFKRPVPHNPRNPFGIDFIIFGDAFFIVTNDVDSNYNWIGTPATDGSLYPFSPGETRVSVSRDGRKFYVLNPALAPAVDGLYPTEGTGDFHRAVDPTLTPADFSGLTEAGIQTLYDGSGGGAGYNISWAQDSRGRSVWLPEIRFIRVEVLSGLAEVDAFSAVFNPHDRDDGHCR